MHQLFETLGSPTPLGDERGNAGPFTLYSLYFCSLSSGGCARNHGPQFPDQGISALCHQQFSFSRHIVT